MKNCLLAVVLGAVVIVLAGSCGPTRCSPSSCLGCCDSSGGCQAGSTPSACGVGALTCQQCFLGSACVNGQCGAFGGGSGGGGGTGGAGGGASPDGGADAGPWWRAYNLAFSSATLAASCFTNGVLPPNPTVPAHTVEALVWQTAGGRQFISLEGTITYKLGDAPSILSPTAVEGAGGALGWQRVETRPFGTLYTQRRLTSARLTFDSLATASTVGTLQLRAEYACVNGSQACPTGSQAPPDAAACQLTVPFTAQLVPLTAKWTTPGATPVTGAQKYLVAIDATPLRTMATPACYRNNQLPAGLGSILEQNTRELDLWQVFTVGPTSYLRTSQQTFLLGDAPSIRLGSDLAADGGLYLQTTSVQGSSTSYLELRQTRLALPLLTGGEATGSLELQAQYSCTAGSQPCPTGAAAPVDAASCQASLPVVAVKLP